MAVLDKPAAMCNCLHCFGTESFPFAKGGRFVIATLVGRFIQRILFTDYVILQFAHHFIVETGRVFQ